MPNRKPANSAPPDSPPSERSDVAHAVSGAPRRSVSFLSAAVIAVAAIAVYYNSFAGVFLFDDGPWIVDNASIRQLWPVWSWLTPENSAVIGGRPLVNLSLALNYAWGGLNPWGYHAVNLAIHILAAWTLFGLVRRTLLLPLPDTSPLSLAGEASFENSERGPRLASVATPLALAAALLWTVHPLQTQAVTYVIQRTESLMALFYLLTLYCVLRGALSVVAGRWWYCAAVLSSFCGMATKEVMVTAPLVVLLYDRTFLSGSFRKALADRWGLYLALAAGWGIIAWQLAATKFHGGTTGFDVSRFTAWSYFLAEPGVLAHYLRLAFWPTGLCLLYDWPPADSLGQILLPGALIVGLLALTVWALVKRPALGFLGAAFFLVLAPTSSFVPILDAAFEHRMYLPLAAVAVLVVLAGYSLFDRLLPQSADGNDFAIARWIVPAVVFIAALAGLGWATVARNADYHSEVDLWRGVVEKYPNHSRSHFSLGCALDAAGKTDEAVAEYEKALAIEPVYTPWTLHNNLGKVLHEQKKYDLAIAEFQKALQFSPGLCDAHSNLGLALHALNRDDLAIPEFELALKINPKFADAHAGLAAVLMDQGRLDEAIGQCRQALALKPQSAATHDVLGNCFDRKGQPDAAIANFRQALAIDPNYAEAHYFLGLALDRQGNAKEAVIHLREAARLKPDNVEYLGRAALVLAESPDPSVRDGRQAVELADRANRLLGGQNPGYLSVLAAAYAEAGDFSRAADAARNALDLAVRQHNDLLANQLRKDVKGYESKAGGRSFSPENAPPR